MIDVLGIIADDLTGAADAAAPFADAGFATRLALSEFLDIKGCQVLSVSTGSRSLPAAEARRRVGQAASRFKELGVDRFYKKIDSTLRGNAVVEIQALLEVVDPDTLVVVCPAFPAVGRTVVDGRLQVDGRPLLESDSARDPIAPVRNDRLSEMVAVLGSSTHLPRSTADDLAEQLTRVSTRVVIADAVLPSDLTSLASACARLDRPVLGVGSGGFAGAIAAQWGGQRVATSKPVLVVVGSRHRRSREQLAELAKRSDASVCELDTLAMEEPGVWERETRALLDHGWQVLAITTVLNGSHADPERVAARLAEVVVELTDGGVGAIVATGGDIAGAILAEARGDSLEVLGEIVPGLPISRVRGGSLASTLIVTKSGGFGDAQTLSLAVEAARRTPEVPYP